MILMKRPPHHGVEEEGTYDIDEETDSPWPWKRQRPMILMKRPPHHGVEEEETYDIDEETASPCRGRGRDL